MEKKSVYILSLLKLDIRKVQVLKGILKVHCMCKKLNTNTNVCAFELLVKANWTQSPSEPWWLQGY